MAVSGVVTTVTWRRAAACVVATLALLAGLVVVLGGDETPSIDATATRATRWFVHEPSGRVVLVDGFGGRAITSLEAGSPNGDLLVAEGGEAAYVLDDATGEVRQIDNADVRLGSPRAIASLGDGVSLARVGPAGLLVANPSSGEGSLLTAAGEPLPLEFGDDLPPPSGDPQVQLAPDGVIWSIDGGSLRRTTNAGSRIVDELGLDDAELSLVGTEPLVLDRAGRRLRYGSGDWFELPRAVAPSELVLQEPGPQESCGWVATGDELWCVSATGLEEDPVVDGLEAGGSDLLAIAGDAAVLVRQGPNDVVAFDWRTGELRDEGVDVEGDAALEVTATTDLIWIDERSGDLVWAVQPWAVQAIEKDDAEVLEADEVDEGGELDEGSREAELLGAGDGLADEELDDPDVGQEDAPIAVDDPVTARSGGSVPVAVTANDRDPDGGAVAVVDLVQPGRGSARIESASTVVYTPDPGYVGSDRFSYTIVDDDGLTASAEVLVELLPADAVNQAPLGSPDRAETGTGVPVVVDVLLNDVDPERDPLLVTGLVSTEDEAMVQEVDGPSGLPALRVTPVVGFGGELDVRYRPVDTFGAVGEEVVVTVEVAEAGTENRPPRARPDALRTKRGTTASVPILANDVDPDGDLIVPRLIEPLPEGVTVELDGSGLLVTPLPGSDDNLTIDYEIDDQRGGRARSSVLVVVVDESTANQPPVAVADLETAVVGETTVLDVVANDTDPDLDPLTVVDVTDPGRGGSAELLADGRVAFTPSPAVDDDAANVRFGYTITDGRGHEVDGDVVVSVLAEAPDEPPLAQDDSAFTYVDEAVVIDVLRNDRDPAGGTPLLDGTPSCPSGGRAVVTADDRIRFEPPRASTGVFRCTYAIADRAGSSSDSASIVISVSERAGENAPPVAELDPAVVEVGERVLIDVLANDTDPDLPDDELRLVSTTQPTLGAVARVDGRIEFTAGDEPGITTFRYTIEDLAGASATGRVSVRVEEAGSGNRPPIAGSRSRAAEPGVPETFAVLDDASDPDGDPLTVVDASGPTPARGTLARSGDSITLTADDDFVGELRATYTISDPDGATAEGTVSIVVRPPRNLPPVAVDDVADLANGARATIDVLFNDTEPDGDEVALAIVSGPDPSLGTASVTPDRRIAFQARPGAAGVASVVYEVSDGELSARATLTVRIATCAASPPGARDVFLRTGYRRPISVDLAAYASNGTVVDVIAPAGYRDGTYTPPSGENGDVTITYGVRNACDQQVTGVVTIDVNQAPSGQDRALALGRGERREVGVGELGSDDEPLSIVGSAGAPGWVGTQPDRLVVAVPSDAPFGTTRWTTTLADPGGLTTVVTISVTIGNQGPVAVGDSVDATGGTTTVDLTANDRDPDGTPGSLRLQSVPSTLTFENGVVGSVAIAPDGRSVTIAPGGGRGAASFTYTVVDDGGAVSAPAPVTVRGPVEPPPTTTTLPPVTAPPTTPPPPPTDAPPPTAAPTTAPPTTDGPTPTTPPPPPPTVPATTVAPTTAPPPTSPPNRAPVASDQSASARVGETVSVPLRVSDPDGDALSVIEVGDPSGIVVEVRSTTLVVRPTSPGPSRVTYRVSDGRAASSVATLTVVASGPPAEG